MKVMSDFDFVDIKIYPFIRDIVLMQKKKMKYTEIAPGFVLPDFILFLKNFSRKLIFLAHFAITQK